MRPAGPVRIALLAVLQTGAVGTFDVLARHVGAPERQARQVLWDLRREGRVAAIRPAPAGSVFPQRERAIYCRAAANDGVAFDALGFARQAWR